MGAGKPPAPAGVRRSLQLDRVLAMGCTSAANVKRSLGFAFVCACVRAYVRACVLASLRSSITHRPRWFLLYEERSFHRFS